MSSHATRMAGGALAATAALGLGAALLTGCSGPRPSLGTASERIEAAAATLASEGGTEATALDGPLTIVSAIRRALRVHPDVLACEHDARVARSAIGASQVRRDPELRAGYRSGDGDQNTAQWSTESTLSPLTGVGTTSSTNRAAGSESTDSEGYAVALRFFPRNPWQARAALSEARSEAYAAEARLRQCMVDTALETCRLYETVRYLAEDLLYVEETVRIRDDMAAQTDDLLRAGHLTLTESLRSKQLRLGALSDAARLRRDLAEARQALARWLGVRMEAVNEAEAWTPELPEMATGDGESPGLAQLALSNRADVAALGWDARACESAYREARGACWPWFSFVQAGYAWDEQSAAGQSVASETDLVDAVQRRRVQFETQESDEEEWRIDLGVTIPVFSWMGQEANRLRAEHEKAQALEARAILDLPHQVSGQLARVRLLADQKRRYVEAAAPLADELSRLAAATAGTAEMTPDERGRILEELVRSRRLSAETAHALNMAVFDLHAAFGTLPVPAMELPGSGW